MSDDLAREIEEAIRKARRGRGVTEAMHRSAVEASVRRQHAESAARQAEAEELASKLADAERLGLPTTPSAVRQALAAKKARQVADAAWLVVDGGPPARRAPARGPRPMTTAPEVAKVRAALELRGQDAGERSIAKYLGVSRDAVRWAEGKDRR